MPTSDSARRRHGFTLLEVLVALAISALGVGALVEAASGGLTHVVVATQYLTALHHAQSHLASVGVETALAAGEQDGDDGDGYHWRIKITPVLAGARAADVGRALPSLYAVEVAVRWRRGLVARTVALDTLRLGGASESDEGNE